MKKKIILVLVLLFALNIQAYGSSVTQPLNNSNNDVFNTQNFTSQSAANTAANNAINGSSQSVSTSSGSCRIPTNILDLFLYALCILDSGVVPFLVGLALILFLVGVVRYVGGGDNEEKRQAGREMMIFGIIALFVMVSIWGLVNILSNSFFGKNSEIQSLPKKSSTVFAPN